jgi:prepilin-type N-terminal cleavage/methylation domain-containing protein
MIKIKSIRSFSSPSGFTLLELILVAGIFAIFAAALVAIINPKQQIYKSHDARRKADLTAITQAIESYYHDNGSYPQSVSGQIAPDAVAKAWGTPWQPYMNILPKDPEGTRRYFYVSVSARQGYILYASLERGSEDPQACNSGQACANITTIYGVDSHACGGVCNYAVSSSDINP